MKSTVTYKEIFTISLPIILGSLTENVISITDTMFMGHVDRDTLGAAAIGNMFYMVFVMVGMGLATGTQIILSRRFGEKNNAATGQTFVHSMSIALTLALGLFGIAKIIEYTFLERFTQSPEIWGLSEQFINIRLFTLIFSISNSISRSFFSGIAETKIIGISSIGAMLLNVFLNYILVFGKMGMPAMGIAGSAIASLSSEGLSTLLYVSWIFYKKYPERFSFFTNLRFQKDLTKGLFKISLPVMFQYALSSFAWFTFFLIIEKMGVVPLAVSNVMRNMYFIFLIPLWGFAVATNTLVNYKIAENKHDEVLPLVFRVIGLSVLSCIFFIVVLNVFSTPILSLFTTEKEILLYSQQVLYILDASSLILSAGIIMLFAIAGTGNTQVKFFIEATIITIYLIYAFGLVNFFKPTIVLVWSAEILYGVLLVTFCYLYLRSGKWRGTTV